MAPLTSSARRVASRTTASESDERPKARKRKADDGDKPSDSRACRRFQYLKPRTRHISQDLIQTRWGPLPAPAQQQVRELLKAAKRPVFLSRHEERRRREAEVVLDHMVKRLEKQLPRMPFPPRSKEVDLNLDALVERNRNLENQITPAMHSIELLRAEIEKEEAALQMDRATLRRLERDSQAEQRAVERKGNKVHPLLESGSEEDLLLDGAGCINLREPKEVVTVPLEDMDPDLLPLIGQFRSHLESMHANAAQVEGMDCAIWRAEIAVDSAFYRRSGVRQSDGIFDGI